MVTEAGNPGNRKAVTDVTVVIADGQDALLTRGVELVDTPGLRAVFDHNTEEAEKALRRMDLAVLVLSADPPISADERDLLHQLRELAVRVLVVINKADRLSTAEATEVEEFTRSVLAEAIGPTAGDVPVFRCSAREGLRARENGDDRTWRSSGLADLHDELIRLVDDHGTDDLRRSIASAARRILVELLDEARVALHAQRLVDQDDADRVRRFAAVLRGLDRRCVEALAVVHEDLRALQAEIDAEARSAVSGITARTEDVVDGIVATAGPVPARVLEDQGNARMHEAITVEVEALRGHWEARVSAGLEAIATRQQEWLAEGLADVRAAALESLGADISVLPAPPPRVGSAFGYALGAEIGWDAPLTSTARRALPGAWGRRRVHEQLTKEAARLVDKHVGRARADQQARIEEQSRRLDAWLTRSYRDRSRRLASALETDRGRRADASGGAVDGPSVTVEELGRLVDRLGEVTEPRDATADGHAPKTCS
jgi:small GTP-binding protein